MCTYVTSTVAAGGSGYGGDDWVRVARAVVYFDHPQDAPLDHALCIDVWGGSDRVAVELDAASARRLANAIIATLEHEEVKPLVVDAVHGSATEHQSSSRAIDSDPACGAHLT